MSIEGDIRTALLAMSEVTGLVGDDATDAPSSSRWTAKTTKTI
jgi:hypothetical protein